MSKSDAFTPLTTLARLPGAPALDRFGSIAEPGADPQGAAADFSIAARPTTAAPLAVPPVLAVWVDVDAVPLPALQRSADNAQPLGPPLPGVAGPPAAMLQPSGGPVAFLLPTDPVFGAAIDNPFGLTDAYSPVRPTFADIDDDGDLDAFVIDVVLGYTEYFRNTGSASAPAFTYQGTNPFGLTNLGAYDGPTFADIDGDGDLDAFVGSGYGTQLVRNTGSASAPAFTYQGYNPFGLPSAGALTFADIDGDGDLDAFAGKADGTTQFFRNTGSATSPAFALRNGNFGLTDVGDGAQPTFADIDGDGDLDAFVGERAGNTQFFRNTGSASVPAFTDEGSNPFGLTDVGSWAKPSFADIDDDGDLDAFVGNYDGIVRFFVNNSAFVLKTPSVIQFTDTAFDDSFATVSRTLSTRGAESEALSFGINGGTNNGSTVSKASAYGVLTMTKATGAYTFVPNDAAIEALGTIASASFTVTATNGTLSQNRTLTLSLLQSGTTETPGNDALTGTSGADRIAGLAGNDSLYGGEGVDTLSGGNDNDLLDGGGSADSMTGGAGNDRYVVQNSSDKIVEASSGGTDSVSSSATYTLASQVEKLTLTGTLVINGTGNGSSNTITGNSAINLLSGGDGNDSLYGMDGVDTLTGGNGNDLLDGGAGNDSMTGGAGNDRYVVQSSGDKVIEASGGGSDSVSSSISWTLPSQVEKLTLTGTSAIKGTGNTANNTITGNTANNSLSGVDGNDSLAGGDGNDNLSGVDGNDTVSGGNGNDTLSGGIGNDSLIGGAGNDSMTGGAGLDIFRFSSALNGSTNVDRLTDFNVVDDRLQLENSVFAKLTTTGVLPSSNFRSSSTGNAIDSNDFVLYDTDGGQLYYDADGSGAGVKVLLATLTTMPVLTSADIFVT